MLDDLLMGSFGILGIIGVVVLVILAVLTFLLPVFVYTAQKYAYFSYLELREINNRLKRQNKD